jgi:hypothetical protein
MDLAYEKHFLKTIIADFQQILTFLRPGIFGQMHSQRVWFETVKQVESYQLTEIGTMYYIYYKMFGEAASTTPTYQQQRNINQVWLAMKLPQNVIDV